MASDSKSPADRTLSTWKEIAAFLNRDVRTVQRWEKEEALPIHRHRHLRRDSVFAYSQELEKWWRERGAMLQDSATQPAAGKNRKWIWLSAMGIVPVLGVLAWVGWRANPDPEVAPIFPAVTFDGTRPYGYLYGGFTGDVNGDGADDVVFSADGAREIYVLFGGTLPATGGELPAAASLLITGSEKGWLGVHQIADYNGNGLQDLLIGVTLDPPEAYRAPGRNYILWGRREWPKSLSLPAAADVTLRRDSPGAPPLRNCNLLGRRGDLNGDAIADVILGSEDYGSPGLRSSGAVFVLHGRKQWPRELEVASAAEITITGSRAGEGLGRSCALGDFNGDGRADLEIYASESVMFDLLQSRGKAYLFFGRKPWPARLNTKTDFDLRVDGSRPNATWSYPLLADLNGDGRDDLVTGWPGFKGLPEHPGEVHIWFGRPGLRGTFPADAADVVIAGPSPGGLFGSALASTDLDRDGSEDLLVSDPARGEVYLLYGRQDWKKRGQLSDYAPVKVFRNMTRIELNLLIRVGDTDGDRLPEVFLVSWDLSVGPREKVGRAWWLKPYIPIRLDVRPGNEPNVVTPSRWTCVARVFGFSPAEQNQIEPSTLRLDGAPPSSFAQGDYNGDGIADLQAAFEADEMKLTLETKRIALTGRTRSGLLVGGSDSVQVIHNSPETTPASTSKPRN